MPSVRAQVTITVEMVNQAGLASFDTFGVSFNLQFHRTIKVHQKQNTTNREEEKKGRDRKVNIYTISEMNNTNFLLFFPLFLFFSFFLSGL